MFAKKELGDYVERKKRVRVGGVRRLPRLRLALGGRKVGSLCGFVWLCLQGGRMGFFGCWAFGLLDFDYLLKSVSFFII